MICFFALGGRIQYTLAVSPHEPTRTMCVFLGHPAGLLVIPWRDAGVHSQRHTVSALSRQSCSVGPAGGLKGWPRARACSHCLLQRLPTAPPCPPPNKPQPLQPQCACRPAPASVSGHPTSSRAPAPNNPQTGGWCPRPARPRAPPARPPCPTTQTQTAPQ